MIGAIIGDIVGSVYEWEWIKTKSFEFFSDNGFVTDDSVCTAAVADALLHDRPPDLALQDWCRRYPDASYGGHFRSWIWMDPPRPYDSFGNGAAMRVSPAAYLNRNGDLSDVLEASDLVTAITHNHPEGLKGARATVHAIWLAFQDEPAPAIRAAIAEAYDYDLSRSVDDIRPGYEFNEICQDTVPEAITCALESDSFEDAVRNAVSLGGDSDTLAAIAGPIAEALHGVPAQFQTEAEGRYIPEDILRIVRELYGAESR
ncbi:MAG: ADP-ribosylglycohydrolase family protein [Chloroflexota bacterium]|nr:ADP-ribosylglycohydrolase family protein [Chloroflexota bacterium]MDE2919513.1 ADP-ribosylglycohydrolase family protein [Chloroflexota bacterium]